MSDFTDKQLDLTNKYVGLALVVTSLPALDRPQANKDAVQREYEETLAALDTEFGGRQWLKNTKLRDAAFAREFALALAARASRFS